ncbi:MAG: D-alanine--D-alanine ligase [Spartobacteria bacterium]|nr:D-alanine--D-alanine ligase [Spartobacteria bacterium]
MTKQFKRVGVLMGGPSLERAVSLVSGRAVVHGLKQAGYDVVGIDVKDEELILPDGLEAVFIALHGEFGEDGVVQRLLTERGIPYTGPGPDASLRSFDKAMCKEALEEVGLPVPAYEVIRLSSERTLPLPIVIKPLRQGSSYGVHRILREQEYERAYTDTHAYEGLVLVEAYIEGRELTVGIVGRDPLPVVEILAPDGNYDYDAKYTTGASSYVVPADLTAEQTARCQELAMATFDTLGCRGLSRVDFRMDKDGQIFILENNTIPGFTPTSLLPKAARQAGIEFPELCDKIMQLACI